MALKSTTSGQSVVQTPPARALLVEYAQYDSWLANTGLVVGMNAQGGIAVVFESLSAAVQIPKRATRESAGYDLSAYLLGGFVRFAMGGIEEVREVAKNGDQASITLAPGERALNSPWL